MPGSDGVVTYGGWICFDEYGNPIPDDPEYNKELDEALAKLLAQCKDVIKN